MSAVEVVTSGVCRDINKIQCIPESMGEAVPTGAVGRT